MNLTNYVKSKIFSIKYRMDERKIEIPSIYMWVDQFYTRKIYVVAAMNLEDAAKVIEEKIKERCIELMEDPLLFKKDFESVTLSRLRLIHDQSKNKRLKKRLSMEISRLEQFREFWELIQEGIELLNGNKYIYQIAIDIINNAEKNNVVFVSTPSSLRLVNDLLSKDIIAMIERMRSSENVVSE